MNFPNLSVQKAAKKQFLAGIVSHPSLVLASHAPYRTPFVSVSLRQLNSESHAFGSSYLPEHYARFGSSQKSLDFNGNQVTTSDYISDMLALKEVKTEALVSLQSDNTPCDNDTALTDLSQDNII
jgi:hypothetical protein